MTKPLPKDKEAVIPEAATPQPSRYASQSEDLYCCYFNQQGVPERECKSKTIVVGENARGCALFGCVSPFRACSACLRVGPADKAEKVVDYERGLCAFHLQYGENARQLYEGRHKRGIIEVKPLARADADLALLKMKKTPLPPGIKYGVKIDRATQRPSTHMPTHKFLPEPKLVERPLLTDVSRLSSFGHRFEKMISPTLPKEEIEPATFSDTPETVGEFRTGREKLKGRDLLNLVDRIAERYEVKKEGLQQISKSIKYSLAHTTNLCSLRKLIPTVRDMIDPQTNKYSKCLPFRAAVAISRLPRHQQLYFAIEVVERNMQITKLNIEVAKILKTKKRNRIMRR